jgi:hypothetical protein
MVEFLARMVERITVHANRLEVAVRIDAIWAADGSSSADHCTELIDVPVQLKRCGMAVRLIVRTPHEGGGRAWARKPDATLVTLVAKAHTWFDRLSSGQNDSVLAIARELRIGSRYVSRVIQLAFLAPDIVQQIVRGDHPVELNADRLIRMAARSSRFGGHASAQKAARAYMRSAGLAYKPVTTYVKAEKAVLEGLDADAGARVHFGRHGSNGILRQPPRQAHAA